MPPQKLYNNLLRGKTNYETKISRGRKIPGLEIFQDPQNSMSRLGGVLTFTFRNTTPNHTKKEHARKNFTVTLILKLSIIRNEPLHNT